MSLIRPVFLTGFMGVGKTKIGSILALRLGRTFFDTDDMIENKEGKSISRIFSEEGEVYFRQLENACVEEVCRSNNSVVALGGGSIIDSRNLDLICQEGVLVCIQATVDTILSRIARHDDRPLLSGLNGKAKREKNLQDVKRSGPFVQSGSFINKIRTGFKPRKICNRIN